jgi:hypothetical protein
MPKKSMHLITAEMNHIRRLLEDSNNTDTKIMQQLKIPERTYYDYKARIYAIDRELWNQQALESLESRALKIMRSLELCIKVNTEIATNPRQDPKARIDASTKVVDANIMAYNLLENGPKPQVIRVLPAT